MKGGEILTGEMEPCRLDHILMGDHDDIAVGMLLVECPGDAARPLCNIGQLLVDEVQPVWMFEVGLQFAWEMLANRVPGMTLPPLHHGPVGEVRMHLDRHRAAGSDLLGGAKGRLLWGRPDRHDGTGPQISADSSGLFQTVG